MKNEDTSKIVLLVLIVGRNKKDAVLSGLSRVGMHMTNTLYGRGTVEANYLKSLLGLVPEENKALIIGMIPKERTERVFNMLMDKFFFDQPNTGIAFTIPVDNLVY